MRKVDENRAENYIKKHRRHKEWIAFALCVSLLTGAITLYMLNKPATAMTEEGAKSIGLVLDTADTEFEEGLIEQMKEEKESSEEENEYLEEEKTQEEQAKEELAEESSSDDDLDMDEDGALDKTGEDEEDTESEEADEATDVKKVIKKVSSTSTKKSLVTGQKKEDVVLTVLYQDKDGNDLEESKELSISESFDLKQEARSIEGYIFTKGFIGEDEITSLVKKTATEDAEVSESEEDSEASTDEEKTETKDDGESEKVVFVDAETGEEVSFDEDEENVEVEVVYEEETDEAKEETKEETKEASNSEYTYYEATMADGSILEVDEDAELKLVYAKVNDKEVFEYEAGGIKVSVKLSDPAVLPADATLKVTSLDKNTSGYNYDAYISALNENAKEIAKANGSEDIQKYDSNNVVLFDICFMYEDKEIQLEDGKASVSITFIDNKISDGLGADKSDDVTVVHLPVSNEVLQEVASTSEATDITAGDISVEIMTESKVDLNGKTDEISFETDSFSVYGAVTNTSEYSWEGSETYTAEQIVSMFGDATYFGAVANNYNGGNNHSEANIAVKKIENIQAHTVGNSALVYTHLTDYKITVNKQVFGASKAGTFNFALFSDIDGKYKISGSEFSITTDRDGLGSYSMDVVDFIKSHAALYVYELDENGNAILNGNTSGNYTVTYEGDAFEGNSDVVSYFSDNYIEDLNGYRITDNNGTGDKGILQPIDGATIYYKTSDSSYVGVSYSETAPNNEVVKLYDGEFPVSISSMLDDARVASSKLAYAKDSSNVKVVNIIGSAVDGQGGGYLQRDLTKRYFKESDNYAVNTGFYIPKDTLLLINVDLTGIDYYTYNKISVNKLGTGDWSDIANQMVVNFVQKDANGDYVPYNGELVANIASGLLTAPDASVKLSGSYSGTVIADDIYKECELHKITTRRFLSQNGTATVTNVIDGAVASIHMYKYLNGEDPGDHQFTFTVRALKHKKEFLSTKYYLETLTNDLKNTGKEINYTFDYDSNYITTDSDGVSNPRVWLVINENDIASSTSAQKITKDDDYIIARIALNEDLKSVKNIYYFRYDSEEHKDLIAGIESSDSDAIKSAVVSDITKTATGNAIEDSADVAFYNVGSGLLRIHKMVVNEFASHFIREDPNAVLREVKFRITNKATQKYLVFQGFVGSPGTHKNFSDSDGKSYTITYNDGAQWTIEGLDAGTYIVEEVADGFTFAYDDSSNSSYDLDSTSRIGADVSRVTKYAVTVDDEDNNSSYGIGGNNWRKLFSRDVEGLSIDPPTEVLVGGKTQTVQVANYYSIPIGPLRFTKNFTGAEWTDKMAFTFKIEPVSWNAYTSEGRPVTLTSAPMPQKQNTTEIENTVTITGADAVFDETTGTYTAVAQFSSIPFKYKGNYIYKITETGTGIDGVKYDSRVYYVRFEVLPKETRFTKKYSYGKNPHTIYVQQGNLDTVTVDDEYFYYLGADVTYAIDEKFNNVVAFCSLTLDKPETNKLVENQFLIDWKTNDVSAVAFNNAMTGELSIKKKWVDINGNDISAGRTSLTLYIWQRAAGEKEWKAYETVSSVQLTPENNWSFRLTGLPLTDGNGKTYEYCVKEPDDYNSAYQVVYKIGDAEYYNNGEATVTIDGTTYKDPGYSMVAGTDGRNFGSVEITNTSVVSNKIPSTGGIGTSQFAAFGALLIAIALSGFMLLKRRKTY